MSRTPQAYLRGHLVVVIDCADLDRSAEFWTSVLGYARDGPPAGPYQGLVPADGQGIEILQQRMPEAKNARTGFTWTCAPLTSALRLSVPLRVERPG